MNERTVAGGQSMAGRWALIICLVVPAVVVVSVALTVLFLLLLAFVEVSYSRRSGRRVAGEER